LKKTNATRSFMRKNLLVTHIPFARGEQPGQIVLDGLWARDLQGLIDSGQSSLTVVAPELPQGCDMRSWGPSATVLEPGPSLRFVGIPPVTGRYQWRNWLRIRAILRSEVERADLIQTSNFFPPYLGLSHAHDHAVRRGKKTLLTIAEDFIDMLTWEWLRVAPPGLVALRRQWQLAAMDRRVRRTAATATLTFMHTPASVVRWRNATREGFAIRQPGHELADVIAESAFSRKMREIEAGDPLLIVAACRQKPLKGLDFLIRAVAILGQRQVPVSVRLYGEGESTAALRGLAAQYGVADRVEFPGALPPGSAIYQAISAAHLFAMPHRTTDFGRAFYDAMAGGCPVLAFRTPASIDTVREDIDGLITPLDDTESLASAIEGLHRDRSRLARLATAARQRGLNETRSVWYQLREARIAELFDPGADA